MGQECFPILGVLAQRLTILGDPAGGPPSGVLVTKVRAPGVNPCSSSGFMAHFRVWMAVNVKHAQILNLSEEDQIRRSLSLPGRFCRFGRGSVTISLSVRGNCRANTAEGGTVSIAPVTPLGLPLLPIASWRCPSSIPARARTSSPSCSASRPDGLDFHGGPHPQPSEAARPLTEATPSGVSGSRRAVRSSLRHSQTQAGCGFPVWRSGVGRYPRGASSARHSLQTVHCPRCGLALRCDSGPHPRHRVQTAALFLDTFRSPDIPLKSGQN